MVKVNRKTSRFGCKYPFFNRSTVRRFDSMRIRLCAVFVFHRFLFFLLSFQSVSILFILFLFVCCCSLFCSAKFAQHSFIINIQTK